METYTVDFGPLFKAEARSNSVTPADRPRDLMKRVLLGPNLVFESSRASLDEPKTVGPANPTMESPWRDDALGMPVSVDMSSQLIRHLSSKGSVMITPVASRKWGSDHLCNKDYCPKGSWVERVFMQQQAQPAGVIVPPMDENERPTSALAVRSLGLGARKIYVVVGEDEQGTLQVRVRRSAKDKSACEADRWIMLPVIAFSAELISMKDGRLVARIDEERPTQPKVEFRRRFKQARSANDDRLCRRIFGEYQDVYEEVAISVSEQLPSVMQGIFGKTLDPLY